MASDVAEVPARFLVNSTHTIYSNTAGGVEQKKLCLTYGKMARKLYLIASDMLDEQSLCKIATRDCVTDYDRYNKWWSIFIPLHP